MAKFKEIFIAIAIALVFVLFVGFGIETFYPSPKYNEFCINDEFRIAKPFDAREECPFKQPDEAEQKACSDKEGYMAPQYDDEGCVESFVCETCQKEFNDARNAYNRNVFIVATGIGILAIITGIAISIMGISSGLMGGGILTFLYGMIRYWSELQDYGRFFILGLTLAILIWLGIRIQRGAKEKPKKRRKK